MPTEVLAKSYLRTPEPAAARRSRGPVAAVAAFDMPRDPVRAMPVPAQRRKSTALRMPSRTTPVSLPVIGGMLRVADVATTLLAALVAFMLTEPDLPLPAGYYAAIAVLGGLVVANVLHLLGSYRTDLLRSGNLAVSRILMAGAVMAATVAGVMTMSGMPLESSMIWLALWGIIGLLPPLVSRALLAERIEYWRQSGRLQQRIAVFGAGPVGQGYLRRVNGDTADCRIIGVYDDRQQRLPDLCMGHAIRGNCDDLVADIRQGHIDQVVIALPLSAERRIGAIVDTLRQVAVDISLCLDADGWRPAECPDGEAALLALERRPLRDWKGIAKDIEDRIVAGAILVMITPLLAAIAALIRLDSPGPVLFRQKRHGLNNELIEVLKFRTMYHHASDPNAAQLTRRNDPRVTRIGAFLRRTSLDELPQFINVLRGEMSVVGPRPHAVSAKAGGLLYADAVRNYNWRHRMKPGITGWAQVSGWRGETERVEQIQKRVEHDIYYIENWSVLMDLQIILSTILGGFAGKNAY